MITNKEYKILRLINQVKDEENTSIHTQELLLKCKIDKLKIEDYELNETMRSLNKQEYICNLFNNDANSIYGTEITDSGLVALKNYKKYLAKYIFKRYIWVFFTILATAALTGYFTAFFTK